MNTFNDACGYAEKSYSALLLDELEEYHEAIDCMALYLETHPTSIPVLNNRGVAYLEIGETEKALADIAAAAHLTINDEIPWENWGSLLEGCDNKVGALEKYKKGLGINPESSTLNVRIADILIGQDLDRDALHFLNEAIRLRPGFEALHSRRAVLYKRLGENDLAELDLATAAVLFKKRSGS